MDCDGVHRIQGSGEGAADFGFIHERDSEVIVAKTRRLIKILTHFPPTSHTRHPDTLAHSAIRRRMKLQNGQLSFRVPKAEALKNHRDLLDLKTNPNTTKTTSINSIASELPSHRQPCTILPSSKFSASASVRR